MRCGSPLRFQEVTSFLIGVRDETYAENTDVIPFAVLRVGSLQEEYVRH